MSMTPPPIGGAGDASSRAPRLALVSSAEHAPATSSDIAVECNSLDIGAPDATATPEQRATLLKSLALLRRQVQKIERMTRDEAPDVTQSVTALFAWEQPVPLDFLAEQVREGAEPHESIRAERFTLTFEGTAAAHGLSLDVRPCFSEAEGRAHVLLTHTGSRAETLALCDAFAQLRQFVIALPVAP